MRESIVDCEPDPPLPKIGRGSAYVSEGRLLRRLVTPSFRTAFVRHNLSEIEEQQNTADDRELYHRGALTKSCWPLCFTT